MERVGRSQEQLSVVELEALGDVRARGGRVGSGDVPPCVSVVIPAHNAAATIADALRSLRAQGAVALEVIVVDDGSTDETARVVEQWMQRDARVGLVRQRRSGVSAARNAGIELASGDWLCFLDADDWLAPKALPRLLALAKDNPDAAVMVGASVRVSEKGRLWAYDSRDLSDAFAVLSTHCAIPIHSALVRRSVVRDLGGFDESLPSSEDWDLWQRIARAGHRFAQTRARVAFYRARAGSLSRTSQSAKHGLAVMRRAHAAHASLPAPQHAGGIHADDLPIHEMHYLLWSAAREIACGGDGLETIAPLEDGRDVDPLPTAIGELMASGMADVLACRPDDLGELWPDYEPKLRRALERAFPGPNRDRLRRITLAATKAALNGARRGDGDTVCLDQAAAPAQSAADDVLILQLKSATRTVGMVALPSLGSRHGADLVEAVCRQVGRIPLKAALQATRPWRTLSFWRAAAPPLLEIRGLGLRAARRKPGLIRKILQTRLRRALTQGLQSAVRAELAARLAGEAASPLIDVLAAEAEAQPGSQLRDRAPAAEAEGSVLEAADPGIAASWDDFFAAEDPWGYGSSAYERLKSQDTLELIPAMPRGKALELGCAEGHFTVQLAERVGELLATDISAKALERAARRCAGLAHVRFQKLDAFRERPPGRFDLIVCSEVLYYAGGRLRNVARRLAAALQPGGVLVMAHSNQVVDEPDATGFDWGQEFGARTIGEVFAATPGLRLEREIHRPLYRIQAFRRCGKDEQASPHPQSERRPLAATLEPAAARKVIWGGGESRIAALRREVAVQVPILMYHRVAPVDPDRPALDRYRVSPEAFEAQIAALRRRGYWGVTPEDLLAALTSNRPLPGRPVMITFDDGYADFADHAWPVLQKHDFPATAFLVAGKVGGTADWDSRYGPPAPLMDWDRVQALASAGLAVESHGLTHKPLTRLGVQDVYREFLTSQALIERATKRKPISICYPFGASDPVIEHIAEDCDFRLGFSVTPGVADLCANAYRLPRVEVSGSDDLERFERKLGS